MEPDPTNPGAESFLRGSRSRTRSVDAAEPDAGLLAAVVEDSEPRPRRYLLREDGGGRYLTSRETPELKVRLQADLSVTPATARKAPEGTIYIDGAAQGEPFLDHERRVFNLDHHEGVIRRFTLAACEQALILVLRGLDLRERPWTILANQPDLDTVLAVWVLLNSGHLGKDHPEIRQAVMPLVRVEGLIDSQGLELLEFSGMDEATMKQALARLDALREIELAAAAGAESEQDAPLESLVAQLEMVDRMVYPADFFEALPGVEELALAELSPDRIAVVCRCDCGIYEAEPVLKRLYGKRLGIVALQKNPGTYTLRQVDSFLPVSLKEAYRRLNLMDPAVRSGRSSNCWGGSGEIGGSPRGSGTRLGPAEIAAVLRLAHYRPTVKERARSVGLAFLLSALVMALGWVSAALRAARPFWAGIGGERDLALFGNAALVAVALLLVAFKAPNRPGLFGIRLPAGWDWLWLAPAAVVGALLGGAWIPGAADPASSALARLAPVLVLPLAAELTFRGLSQGLLMERLRAQQAGGPWFVSWPAALSTLYFVLWTALLQLARPAAGASLIMVAAGALLLGLALGVGRERAESLLGPLSLHYLGVSAVLFWRWLF